MRLVPYRLYKAIQSWDLFPIASPTAGGLLNDSGKVVNMPATCNRQRIYIAALTIGGAYTNSPGDLNCILKGYDNQDQLMIELPIGVHNWKSAVSGAQFPILNPNGFSEQRLFNRYTANSFTPLAFTQQTIEYGWTMRAGEGPNTYTSEGSSGLNPGVSNPADNMFLHGWVEAKTNQFSLCVAPYKIEAPVAKWKIDFQWVDTANGAALSISAANIYAVVFGLFIGEQV